MASKRTTPEQKEAHRLTNKRYRERNREKIRLSARRYRKTHPSKTDVEWQRNYDLQRYYGITLQDKIHMFEEQEGRCKLCQKPLLDLNCRDTHIEHKPGTKIVRGLVHCKCNQLIKAIETLPTLIETTRKYLGLANGQD